MFSRLRFYSRVITRTIFSIKMLCRVQVFQGRGFSGSRFFRVQVFQGPGLPGSWSRVRVQVLKVTNESQPNIFPTENLIKKHAQWFPLSPLVAMLIKFVFTKICHYTQVFNPVFRPSTFRLFCQLFWDLLVFIDITIDCFWSTFIFGMYPSITFKGSHWYSTNSAWSDIKKRGFSLFAHLLSTPFRRRFSNSVSFQVWLKASKFTTNELLHSYFSRTLLKSKVTSNSIFKLYEQIFSSNTSQWLPSNSLKITS